MSDDILVLSLHEPLSLPLSSASAVIRPVHTDDRNDLAELYLHSYPPEIGAPDPAAALAEMDATFNGEYGELRPR